MTKRDRRIDEKGGNKINNEIGEMKKKETREERKKDETGGHTKEE